MMKRVIFLLLLFCGWVNFAYANTHALRVGVFPDTPPISFVDQNQHYHGVAVSMWEEIAARLSLKYSYIPIHSSYDQAVLDLAAGKYDILVGPVSVTHKRLQIISYSRPFFLNKMGLVVKKERVNFFTTIGSIFGATLLVLLVIFLVSFVIFSHVFWLCERGKCKQVSKNYINGIKEAMWTTITSFLRDVLYDPKSTGARVVLGFWLLLSVIFMATISAVVTATLTYSLTQHHAPFEQVSDLNNRLVGVQSASANTAVAMRTGAKVQELGSLYHALQELAAGRLDGVVGDYFLVQALIKSHHELNLRMSRLILTNDEYAFALPKGSKLKQPIDIELTNLQDKGFAAAICKEYLYGDFHSCEF